MIYFVSMQETDSPFSFTHAFSKRDAFTILKANVGVRVELDEQASGSRLDDGDFVLTMKSPGGGTRLYSLNFAELCRQLSKPSDDEAE